MKYLRVLLTFISMSIICIDSSVAQNNCAKSVMEFNRLNDSAQVNIKRKFFITANSYFKASAQLKNLNDSCRFDNEKISEISLSIIPASTYQSLLESVIDLQENEKYKVAFEKYKVATKYYNQFQISQFDLKHDSIIDFVFKKCKGGFANWLSEYFFEKQQFEKTFFIYNMMIERSYDAKKIKRPLYDLGLKMALRDKSKNMQEKPKQIVKKYTNNNPSLKYFEMGYLYGWK